MLRFDPSHQLLAVGVAILAGFVDEVVVVAEGFPHPLDEGSALLAPVLVDRPLGEFLLAGFLEKEHGGGGLRPR